MYVYNMDASVSNTFPMINYNIGYHLAVLDKPDSAIIFLNRELMQKHPYFNAYVWLSKCYVKKGNNTKALEIMNNALKKHPEEPLFYWQRGLVYMQQNNKDKATLDFKKCLALENNDGITYYDIAMFLYKNKPDKICSLLKHAITLQIHDFETQKKIEDYLNKNCK